jgi:hypothetical protein
MKFGRNSTTEKSVESIVRAGQSGFDLSWSQGTAGLGPSSLPSGRRHDRGLMEPPNKSAQRPPRYAGDCLCALSVSALRVWLGQDRLSSVLASEAILRGE